MARYRILSFDGGGIRGIVSTIILQRLVEEPELAGFLDSVDLFAGTSTGGLVALGLAHGLSPAQLTEFYEKRGALIFADSFLDNLLDLGKLIGADYKTKNLREELKSVFGEATTLGDLKRRVVICSFLLDNEKRQRKRTWKPKVFHNFEGPGSDSDRQAFKVGLYTTAAPTYFPSVNGYIDGGVYANNPSMCALAQTQDKRYRGAPALSDVVLLSVGTGTSLDYIDGKTLDWGYFQWAQPLLNMVFDGVAGIADFQCQQLLEERYYRIAPVFRKDGREGAVRLDDVKRIPYLILFARRVPLGATIEWIKKNWL